METTRQRPSIGFPLFPENLRRARKEKGLSFRMLSLVCLATPSNLCRYEQGIHMPRIDTLESISSALGVPVKELLGPYKESSWVGLTNEEIHMAFCHAEYETNNDWNDDPESWCRAFASHLEATLKEKNHGR